MTTFKKASKSYSELENIDSPKSTRTAILKTLKKTSKSYSALDNIASPKSKKSKKKERLDRHSSHKKPIRRQDTIWTLPIVGKALSSNSLLSSTSSIKKNKKSVNPKRGKVTRQSSLPDLSEHSRSLKDVSKHSRKGGTKKRTRRNSLPGLSKHSRDLEEDVSKHSRKAGARKAGAKKKSSSGGRPNSRTDLANPLDRFFKSDKNGEAGESSSSTVDTTPSTPYAMRPVLDLTSSSGPDCTVGSSQLDATASSVPTLSDESPIERSTSSGKKASRRNSTSSKKPSSSRKLKDKKKSKKNKKQKKSSSRAATTKEKDKHKKSEKTESGSLDKHLSDSNCSLGSFSSQKSFSSDRSFGSCVSDVPTYVSDMSFVSFVSVSVRRNSTDNTLSGSSNHSHRSLRGIRKVRRGTRKIPQVSMPEHASQSPYANRKAFNDNASSHTSCSFSSHNTSKQRYGILVSPGVTGSQQRSAPNKSLSMLTLRTAESSSYDGCSRWTDSNHTTNTATTHNNNHNNNNYNSIGGGFSSPRSKFQMVPKKYQSFSDPNSRWRPPFTKSSSAPSFSERTGSRTSLLGIPNEPSPSFPATTFCSVPKATHPDHSLANDWSSPFEDVEVKYVDGKDWESSSGGGKLVINTRSSLTIKKPPADAFDDNRSESSEDSEIDDPWESYGPASLMRSSTYPNTNANTSATGGNNHDSSSCRESSVYSDDDISALTMSLQTDGSSLGNTNSPAGRNPRFVASSSSPERRRVRPRSPTPPKLRTRRRFDNHESGGDDDESQRERFMRGFDVSGTEGSVSLHDCSVRSERSEKRTTRPRKNTIPTIPRIHTPPRIRFGESASDSPRGLDRSPSMPQRKVSHHDRGDEPSTTTNNNNKNNSIGIPVVPNLDPLEKTSRDKLGDIEEVTDRTEDEDDHVAPSSHGVCDDADAAAGNPTPPEGHRRPIEPNNNSAAPVERMPPPRAESFGGHGDRLGALIGCFEALDGHWVNASGSGGGGTTTRMPPSPSPSFRRRPKGLQPMLPADTAEAAGVRRSPSMPVTPSKTPKAKTHPPRYHSDLNTSSSSQHKKDKKKTKKQKDPSSKKNKDASRKKGAGAIVSVDDFHPPVSGDGIKA